jgi:hypothetical protein
VGSSERVLEDGSVGNLVDVPAHPEACWIGPSPDWGYYRANQDDQAVGRWGGLFGETVLQK